MKFALHAVGCGSTARPEVLGAGGAQGRGAGLRIGVDSGAPGGAARDAHARIRTRPTASFPAARPVALHDPFVALAYVAALHDAHQARHRRLRAAAAQRGGGGEGGRVARRAVERPLPVRRRRRLAGRRVRGGRHAVRRSRRAHARGDPHDADAVERGHAGLRRPLPPLRRRSASAPSRCSSRTRRSSSAARAPAALRRAASSATAGSASRTPPTALRPLLATLREHLAARRPQRRAGSRSASAPAPGVRLDRDTVRAFADAGVHRLIVFSPGFVPRGKIGQRSLSGDGALRRRAHRRLKRPGARQKRAARHISFGQIG